MAGRGRGMTLPAWMTQGTAPAQGPSKAEVEDGVVQSAAAQSYPAAPATATATATVAAAPAAAVTAQPSSSVNPGEDRNNWTTHTAPDGRPYYYNKVLNVSTYDQPNCLKTAAAASPAPAVSECRWREYMAPDGRPYYSDGKESRWDMPEELRLWKERTGIATTQPAHVQPQPVHVQPQPVQMQPQQQPVHVQQPVLMHPVHAQQAPVLGKFEPPQSKVEPIRFNLDPKHEPMKISLHTKPAAHTAATSKLEPAHVVTQPRRLPERKPEPGPAVDQKSSQAKYASEAEAMDAFKLMLSDFKVSSTMKWKEVESQLANQDPRWHALKSNGQKRQALAEYQNAKGKEEKQLQRQRARKARDNFLKLLAENTEIDHRTTWREATRILGEEPRFTAVEDDREREEIYSDFVFELAKKEKQDREAAISAGLDAFRELIKNDPNVTNRSLWADYKERVAGFEDPRLAALSELDMRRAFQDYVAELDRQQKAAERAEREAKERAERQHRDALRDTLLRMVAEGSVHSKSIWSEVQAQLEGFEALQALDPKVAAQEFDGVVYDMQRQLRTDIRNTRDAVRQFKLPLTGQTTFQDFLHSISEWEAKLEGDHDRDEREQSLLRKEYYALKELAIERVNNLSLAFEEIKADVVRDEEARAKKQAKRERRFKELLEDFYYRSDHIGISWDEAKRELAEEREYHDLERSDRKRLFHVHMEELASKMAVKTKAIKEHLASDDKKQSHEEEEGEQQEQNGAHAQRSPSGSSERGRSRKRSSSRSRSGSRSRSRSDSRSSRSRSRSRSGGRYVKVKHAKHEDLELEAGEVADDSDIERNEKGHRRDKDKKKKKHKHKHEKKSKKSKRSKRSASSDRSESRKRSRRSGSRS